MVRQAHHERETHKLTMSDYMSNATPAHPELVEGTGRMVRQAHHEREIHKLNMSGYMSNAATRSS